MTGPQKLGYFLRMEDVIDYIVVPRSAWQELWTWAGIEYPENRAAVAIFGGIRVMWSDVDGTDRWEVKFKE